MSPPALVATLLRCLLGAGLAGSLLGAAGCDRSAPPAAEPAPAPAPAPEPVPARRPNILLLSVDTLRRDSLAVYSDGAPALPHLDAFAEGAVVFEEAHSTASWTLPAQASLLTGLYPDQHGATSAGRRLRPDVPTLAGALRERGFHTVALTDGGYLHPSFGMARGFDRYDTLGKTRKDRRAQASLPRGGARNPVPGSTLFDRAIAFLETREDPAPPFFLFLQTYAVHDYFLVHPWAAEVVGPDGLADKEHYHRCTLGEAGTSEDWRHLEALYRAELTHLDQGFGRLLEALRARGLEDDTWVLLVSDHGEGFAPERGRIHHAGRLHEDLIRIPFLVRGPGLAPRSVAAPVSLVDVLPTLLEMTGPPGGGALDGVSLAPLLQGGTLPDARFLYAMEHHQYWEEGRRWTVEAPRDFALSVAVLRGPWWYIQGGADQEELYHMTEDPGQFHPLPVEDREGLALRDLARRRAEQRVVGTLREIDPEAEAELRALGYVR